MKAMILAAGRGERLRPITDTTPKPLLMVKSKALIVHHLEALARDGFKQVVINVCWLADQIKQNLGDGSQFNLSIDYSEESQALETAGGIVQALPLLGDEFIVVNADIFTDYNFSKLRDVKSDAHIVLVDSPKFHPHGDFGLKESTVFNKADKLFTYSGISKYNSRFFESLDPGRQGLAPLLRQAAARQKLTGELHSGSWTDIGLIERLNSLQ